MADDKEFFDIKDIGKINFNKLVRLLPGGTFWQSFTTRGQYITAILRSQKVFLDNNIDTALRIAHFIAQGLIETGFLKYKTENLNYSAERLMQIFPRHFPGGIREAQRYERNPRKIANRVYANRLGNGDEASGDGWRYRGRGFFQLTGRDNYRRFGEIAGYDLERDPEILERNLKKSIEIAASYFNNLGLGSYADQNDVRAVSRGINRGNPETSAPAHGESERIVWTRRVLDLVRNPQRIDQGADDYEGRRNEALPDQPDGLSLGERGSDVREVQRALNLLGYNAGAEDGVFGVNTERAVANFQRENGLEITGAVNSATMNALDEALADTRKSIPPGRLEANDRDATRAGNREINDARNVGNAGAAVGGASAAGAAAESGAIEEGREALDNMTGGDSADETPSEDAPSEDRPGDEEDPAEAEPSAEPAEDVAEGEQTAEDAAPEAPEAEETDDAAAEDAADAVECVPTAAATAAGADDEDAEAAAETTADGVPICPPEDVDVEAAEAEEAEDAEEAAGEEPAIEDEAEATPAAPQEDAPEATSEPEEEAPSTEPAPTPEEEVEEAAPAEEPPAEEPEAVEAEPAAPPEPQPQPEPAPEPTAEPEPEDPASPDAQPTDPIEETPLEPLPPSEDEPVQDAQTEPDDMRESIETPPPPPPGGAEPQDGGVDIVRVGILIVMALAGAFIFTRSRRVARDRMDAYHFNR
ncbi:MAG: peptidoglycan-binding protein [Pseudomonadota bacterium]